VYTFANHQGGAIHMDSALEQGTTVSLYFPRYEGTAINLPASEADKLAEDEYTTASILVVDDEPALCLFVSEVLEDKGYSVLQAANGDEALNCLLNEKIDLVISDVLMPGMDGYRLAQKIQTLYPHIKIQLMSGYTDNKQTTTADRLLSESILKKPMGSTEILKKVAALLKS